MHNLRLLVARRHHLAILILSRVDLLNFSTSDTDYTARATGTTSPRHRIRPAMVAIPSLFPDFFHGPLDNVLGLLVLRVLHRTK